MYRITQCQLCSGRSFVNLYARPITYVHPWRDFIDQGAFPFVINGKLCARCGWIFKDIAFTADELNRLYNAASPAASLEAEAFADKNAEYRSIRIFETVQPWLPSRGRILDVGGRRGELMCAFVERGYDVTVIDMDGGAAISPRIRKVQAPFTSFDDARYDLVSMSHVLEHVTSPSDFLAHAKKLLAPNGLLFIEVPSELLTCLVKRHVGDHRHLCYFTKQTLGRFIESAGLECLSCRLLVDMVGNDIPLLRAVARKSLSLRPAKLSVRPGWIGVLKSLSDVVSPQYAHALFHRIRAL